MMDCKRIEQLLPAYTLGSLTESETTALTAHVDACAPCAVNVREAGDTLVNLARMVPQKRPSARVKARLFASIDREKQPGGRALWNPDGVRAVSLAPTGTVSRYVRWRSSSWSPRWLSAIGPAETCKTFKTSGATSSTGWRAW